MEVVGRIRGKHGGGNRDEAGDRELAGSRLGRFVGPISVNIS